MGDYYTTQSINNTFNYTDMSNIINKVAEKFTSMDDKKQPQQQTKQSEHGEYVPLGLGQGDKKAAPYENAEMKPAGRGIMNDWEVTKKMDNQV